MSSPLPREDRARPGQVRPLQVLRNPKIWIFPTAIVSLVVLLLSLFYMGGIVDPNGNLHRLPVGLVNADRGGVVAGRQTNLGAQITDSIATAADPRRQASWRRLDQSEAQQQLASGRLDGVLEVPAGFTAAVAALGSTGTASPARPTLNVLTNPGVGSLASSFASTINQTAAHQASRELGKSLTAAAPTVADGSASSAARLLLADPITVSVQVGHPIGTHSGLGLTAFYYTLLLVLAGFMGGNVISNGVDVGLGYADSEIGPWHTRRPAVPINRTRTLLVKWVMSVVVAALTSGLIMLMCVALLGMDASHLWLLWVFSFCASATVGLGVQSINAAFGGIGQLVSMFVFIVLALPSSGATIPLEALPGFYRWLAVFEPMRQLSGGMRAILYFDARAEAGLTRAWIMIAIGVAVALAFGLAATSYYDRKGLHRMVPETS
ncbi:YhgE/Pip domain-containing protein [Streptacidiphilus sp. EB103A]|uniref:YhgE/Pip domain-containing protein n=1 Tax=Streptacidiphilus sp. EB103A TaxID=3156275 RepID=UPI0035168A82